MRTPDPGRSPEPREAEADPPAEAGDPELVREVLRALRDGEDPP
jgi:ABC-type histidine transport system ATPase subunit